MHSCITKFDVIESDKFKNLQKKLFSDTARSLLGVM